MLELRVERNGQPADWARARAQAHVRKSAIRPTKICKSSWSPPKLTVLTATLLAHLRIARCTFLNDFGRGLGLWRVADSDIERIE
jgi:hypothetical protein